MKKIKTLTLFSAVVMSAASAITGAHANWNFSDTTVHCAPQTDGTFSPADSLNLPLGDYGFSSQQECQNAIQFQASQLVCNGGPYAGAAQAFSLKSNFKIGSTYYSSLGDCLKAIQGSIAAGNGLLCNNGFEHSYVLYDLKTGHFLDRDFHDGSIDDCNQAIQSPAVLAERVQEAPIPATVGDFSTLRLDAPGGSMEHVAVRDQRSMPICYAEAVAGSIDAYRFTHGDTNYGFQTSAIFIALNTDKAFRASFTSGFQPDEAIAQVAGSGICSMSATLEGQDTGSLPTLINTLQSANSLKSPGEGAAITLSSYDLGILKQTEDNLIQKNSLPGYSDLVQLVESSPNGSVLPNVLAYGCHGPNLMQVTLPPFKRIFEGGKLTLAQIAQSVSSALSSKSSLPLNITICDQIYYEKNYRNAYDNRGSSMPVSSCSSSEIHQVLIIGKRVNPGTNRPEFLVRQSASNDCGDARQNFGCDHGSFWIDADTLAGVLEVAYNFE